MEAAAQAAEDLRALERLEQLEVIPRSADLSQLMVAVAVKAVLMQRYLLAAAVADRQARAPPVAARRPLQEETLEMQVPPLPLAGRVRLGEVISMQVVPNTEARVEVATPLHQVLTQFRMVAGQCSEGPEGQAEAVSMQAMLVSPLAQEGDADFTRLAVALAGAEVTVQRVQPEKMEA